MNSSDIRDKFLTFFQSKGHLLVPSAPIVVKNDPSLMFTNAGMNQFKDFFLGHEQPKNKRIADTQKCLRVSGKHNDLEEVGIDTYHHTMFEMLGNWSFGDYFKKEAIGWAWELLTEVYKIDKNRLYATVFEGDKPDNLPFDEEAFTCWLAYLPKEHIVYGNKKDNFWEMGDTGPCGPCSEIHVDLRSDEERKKIKGKELVNTGNPRVIEIWNLVFMQFNRKANGALEKLPARHVDTGMGFERLCMVLQNKQSSYDTDVFQPLIKEIEQLSGKRYKAGNIEAESEKINIAIRVIADHIRAVAFAIADGQLPSNTGAGYVIRRILRRAVRYGYQSLELKEPFLYKLVDVLAEQMGVAFPEVIKQEKLIKKVIQEEEVAFLRTLEKGIARIDSFMLMQAKKFAEYAAKSLVDFIFEKINPVNEEKKTKLINETIERELENEENIEYFTIPGYIVFELYDTYGFPVELTQLIAKDTGFVVDSHPFEEMLELEREKKKLEEKLNKRKREWIVETKEFDRLLQQQKNRSRTATVSDKEDWIVLRDTTDVVFTGYTNLEEKASIVKYRKVKAKNKEQYHIVLDKTPFYAESGGQVGDTGYLQAGDERIRIIDTQKEHGLIIHSADALPQNPEAAFTAIVNPQKRILTADNHSATHLLHAALRKTLGKHVEQRGSLVNADYLRFDFSHFSKITDEELKEIESVVNQKIRENIPCETRIMPIEEAKKLGAMALFGEKYGDTVRVVTMDKNYSIELCGGTHVKATGQIGFFKILTESAVSAGIRRIEAVTALKAEEYVNAQFETIRQTSNALKAPKNILKAVQDLQAHTAELSKQVEVLSKEQAKGLKAELLNKKKQIGDVFVLCQKIDVLSPEVAKDICFQLKNEIPNLFLLLGAEINDKAYLFLALADNLVKEKKWNASALIREFSKEINGSGGGQSFYATAGGKNITGIGTALGAGEKWVSENK